MDHPRRDPPLVLRTARLGAAAGRAAGPRARRRARRPWAALGLLAAAGCPLDWDRFGRTDGGDASRGFPSASTTGVPAGTRLIPSGSFIADVPGRTYENLDVAGCVTIRATNVTVRNTRVRCADVTAVNVEDGASATLLDSDFAGTTDGCDAAVTGARVTGTRLDLSRCRRGALLSSGSTLQDSYVHDLRSAAGNSLDGVRVSVGTGIALRHNRIEVGPDGEAQSGVFMKPDFGPVGDVTVADNLLVGANHSLIFAADCAGCAAIANARFTNNRLRDWQLAPTLFERVDVREWTGNVNDATGEPIPAP